MSSRKRQALLTTISTLTLLVVFALGTAGAEPKMNQIVIEDATCTTEDGQSSTYTFVINAMSKAGLLVDSTDKTFVITSYTLAITDRQGDENVLEYDPGTETNPQDGLLSCSGQIETELQLKNQNLGEVTVDYEFQGFLAPG